MENNLSREMLSQLKFCVFDLETTGGNQKTDSIIEIGLVRIENLKIVAKKSYLIRPEVKIPEFIQKLTTIREEDVKDAPPIEDVIHEILEFMNDSILVAHNISFDIPFFNSILLRLKLPGLNNKSICTNLMTKYLIPNLLNTNLNYMSRIFEIGHQKAHRALDDAYASAELLLVYLNIFIEKGVSKINHLYYPRNKYELDRAHFKNGECNISQIIQKLDSLNCSYLITFKGENGIILSSLPCQNSFSNDSNKFQRSLLEAMLSEKQWEMVSIRLFGNFIEALMHFAVIYPRIEAPHRGEIISNLEKIHFPEGFKNSNLHKSRKDLSEQEIVNWSENNIGDFILAHHIVPDQMIIIPVLSFSFKNQMIFRFPGHQKKLIQFINSRSSKLTSMKNKTLLMQGPLRDFYFDYLEHAKQNNTPGIKLIDKNFPVKNPNAFLEELTLFSKASSESYRYPKKYI